MKKHLRTEGDPTHTESLTSYLILLGFSLIYFTCGIMYGWAEQNTCFLASSIIALFVGFHLISYLRVALKYRKIVSKIFDKMQVYSVHFWNLRCDITMKNDSPLSLLYLPGFCPYYFWIIISYGIPMGGNPPEHIQIWKSAPWLKERAYMNPYDYSRYFRCGLLGRISKRLVCMPVERTFSVIDEGITEKIPDIGKKGVSMHHLVKIGFARHSGKNILLAILDNHASLKEIVSTIEILEEIDEKMKKSNT